MTVPAQYRPSRTMSGNLSGPVVVMAAIGLVLLWMATNLVVASFALAALCCLFLDTD